MGNKSSRSVGDAGDADRNNKMETSRSPWGKGWSFLRLHCASLAPNESTDRSSPLATLEAGDSSDGRSTRLQITEELLTRKSFSDSAMRDPIQQNACIRIEEAYNCVLRHMPGSDVQERLRLKQAKDCWKDMVRHHIKKGKSMASEQVSDVMQKSWDKAIAPQGEMHTFFDSLRYADVFNRIKHTIPPIRDRYPEEYKKRDFDALSQQGKSLVEEYLQFIDGITDFEHPDLRNVPLKEQASIIGNEQKKILKEVTSEQWESVLHYCADERGYININAFCRFNGDDYASSSDTRVTLEPEYRRKLVAIPGNHDEIFNDLLQDSKAFEDIRRHVEVLDNLIKPLTLPHK
ncbi:MAG TPA: hypothetical protein VGL94_11360 [Ktedonobacteraceae bacterium]